MFTSQRSSKTALLPVLAVLLVFFTKEQTALSTESTAAPVVSNSSLSVNNESLSSVTGMKSHRPCGSEMVDYCANGGQCVYYQDQEKPSCMCNSPFEGPRCMTITSLTSKCSNESQSFLVIVVTVVGVSMVIFILAIILFCCFQKRCVKSAKIQV